MRNSLLLTLGVLVGYLLATLYPAIKQTLVRDWPTLLPLLLAVFLAFELQRL